MRVVVDGEHVLDDLDEYPEAFLFVQVLEQVADDEIHALAVANGRIPLQERIQHIPKRANILFYDIFWIIWERSLQVELYLVEAWIWIVDIVVSQDKVVIAVRFLVNKHAIRGF